MSNGNAHHLTLFRATSASWNHQHFHRRRSFRSNSSLNNNFYGEYQNNYSHDPNISLNGQRTSHLKQRGYMVNDVNLLTTIMGNHIIIQAAISLVETFDGDKKKFETWIRSVENAAQISGQDIIWIAFPKMIGSPLISAHRLREGSPKLMWKELKSNLSRKYSSISFDSHATKAFPCLQQGPDELFKMYLHCASDLLSKIHHTSDMSWISVEGLNCSTMVYDLTFRKLRESLVGHQSMLWRSMEDCFIDICEFGTDYKRATAYGRAEFDTQEASTVN